MWWLALLFALPVAIFVTQVLMVRNMHRAQEHEREGR